MKATTALCLAIAVAAFAGPANAIFKCSTAKGVVYQDRPCRDGNESDINIVIPTGELAPRASGAVDDGATANNPRSDDRANAPRASRNLGEPAATRSAERRGSDSAANRGETSLRGVPVGKGGPGDGRAGAQGGSFRQLLRHGGIQRRRGYARPDELRIALRRKAGLLPEQRQADVDLISRSASLPDAAEPGACAGASPFLLRAPNRPAVRAAP